MADTFQFGNAKVNAAGFDCCGKPVGCDMTHDGCAYLRHPWKRAVVFGDPTARCPMTRVRDGRQVRCALLNGHPGPCEEAT